MQSKPNHSKWNLSEMAFIAIWTCGLFFTVVKNPFVNLDDPENFLQNPYLTTDFLTQLSWSWGTGLLGVYQPIVWNLLWVQSYFSGLSPYTIHFFSVVLHAVNVVLIYGILDFFWVDLKKSENPLGFRRGALAALLLFALHPLRVEAVAWASCQPYLWSTLFGLLSVQFYLKALRQRGGVQRHRILSLLFFVLGILCKAILFTLPLVFLLLRFYFNEDKKLKTLSAYANQALKWAWNDKFFWLVMFFALSMNVYFRGINPQGADPKVHGFLVFAIPFVYFFFTILKTALPWPLCPFNTMPVQGLSAIAILLVLVFAVGVFYWARKQRNRVFLVLFVFVLCLPGLSSAFTEKLAFEDRFSYLPSIALSIGLVPILSTVPVFFWALGMALIYSFLTYFQTYYWKDSEKLWMHAVQTGASDSAMAFGNLGMAYVEKGELNKADESLQHALQLDATRPEIHNGLGLIYVQKSQLDRARYHLQIALQIRPRYAEALNNLGYLEYLTGHYAEAVPLTDQALAVNPRQSKTYELRAMIFEALKDWGKALQNAQILTQLTPYDAEAQYILGRVLLESGKANEAMQALSMAIRINPNYALSRLLLAQSLLQQGYNEQAREQLLQALQIDPKLVAARELLSKIKP